MGRAISEAAKEQDGIEVVCGVDCVKQPDNDVPVFTSFNDVDIPFDMIIDFSVPSVVEKEVAFALSKKVPLIVGTTGLSEEQVAMLEKASETIPVFRTANMSVGVNLQVLLSQIAESVLGKAFDVEIVERHHRLKVDAPSGTALMLADAIAEKMEEKPEYVYDRQCKREKRTDHEIGIHSVRGGTIVGEHEVSFIGQNEVITITHQAFSKGVFAEGALKAALFLKDKESGMYSMKDILA